MSLKVVHKETQRQQEVRELWQHLEKKWKEQKTKKIKFNALNNPNRSRTNHLQTK